MPRLEFSNGIYRPLCGDCPIDDHHSLSCRSCLNRVWDLPCNMCLGVKKHWWTKRYYTVKVYDDDNFWIYDDGIRFEMGNLDLLAAIELGVKPGQRIGNIEFNYGECGKCRGVGSFPAPSKPRKKGIKPCTNIQ